MQCIMNTTKVIGVSINYFKITSSYAWRMNIYIEKPYEKLYMINVIDLHILKQSNMHTSNDVYSGSTGPVISIKVMLNVCNGARCSRILKMFYKSSK